MKRFVVCALSTAAAFTLVGQAVADVSKTAISQAYKKASAATAILQYFLEAEDGQRSERDAVAVVVGADGLVMTSIEYFPSNLRTEDIKDLTIVLGIGESRKEYPAEVVSRDEEARVAFIRPKGDKLPKFEYINFVQSKQDVGDDVIVISVVEKAVGYMRSFNVGRINAVLEKPYKMYPVTNDARGVSGAPVFDANGKAIGIFVNYLTSRRGIVQSFGGRGGGPPREGMVNVQIPVVLPTERFASLIKSPPKAGEEKKRAWTGIASLQPLTADLAQYFGLPKGGIIVGQVVKGSPAEAAGVKAEDVIVKFGGADFKQDEDKILESFSQYMRTQEPGKEQDVTVWRPSTKSQIALTLTPQPRPKTASDAQRYTNRTFGFTVREVVVEDMLGLRLNDTTGALVNFVQSSSWAGQAQLRPGDIVKKISDTQVNTLEDFQKGFEKAVKSKPKEIFFQVLRDGRETAIIRIEPRWESVEKE